MRILVATLTALGLLAGGLLLADDDDKRERKQREAINDLAEKLGRRVFAYPNLTAEQKWLHDEAASLLERAKQARDRDYQFDRLARAADALLEASERILEAREEEEDHDEDDREDTARDLERDYFRVQQSEYFAEQSREENAREYVTLARSLYQQARRTFDASQYDRSEKLGDAASYVVRALEYLAQAAVREPEPPRL